MRFLEIGSKLLFVFSPIPAYFAQILEFLKHNDSSNARSFQVNAKENNLECNKFEKSNVESGFSPIGCLLLLLAHILRIIYFSGLFWQKFRIKSEGSSSLEYMRNGLQNVTDLTGGKNGSNIHFENEFNHKTTKVAPEIHYELPGNSVVMVCVMILLVYLITAEKRRIQRGHRNNCRNIMFTRNHQFWQWDRFEDYLAFLAAFTLYSCLICYFLFMADIGLALVGTISVLIEANLPLPQFLKNKSRQDTNGVSLIMVLGWCIGDAMKVAFFLMEDGEDSEPEGTPLIQQIMESTVLYACGAIYTLFIDILVLVQVLILYPSQDVSNNISMVKSFIARLCNKVGLDSYARIPSLDGLHRHHHPNSFVQMKGLSSPKKGNQSPRRVDEYV